MGAQYTDEIDNFLLQLGPPEHMYIDRSEVGCIVCHPKFIVTRNFNTKAKLVNHFKSTHHDKCVRELETNKDDHSRTLEENLTKLNEEIENTEAEISEGAAKIKEYQDKLIAFKEELLEEKKDKSFDCPVCNMRTTDKPVFKEHLKTHKTSTAASDMLARLGR